MSPMKAPKQELRRELGNKRTLQRKTALKSFSQSAPNFKLRPKFIEAILTYIIIVFDISNYYSF